MQIEKPSVLVTMSSSSDIDCVSILSKLILLTEQYKRVNELLENKKNMLKQRALKLQMRRLKHQCYMQKMCITLTEIEANYSNNKMASVLIGQTAAVQNDTK